MHTSVIILGFILFLLATALLMRKRKSWISGRASHPGLWRAAFVDSNSQASMKEALDWVVQAFLLPPNAKYALRPSDRIWDIYTHENPSFWDNMDFETLALFLEDAGHDHKVLEDKSITVRDLVYLHAGTPIH